MTEAVVKALKKVVDISNSNLVKNTDGLLSKRPANNDIEWIGPQKKRLPENRYKIRYQYQLNNNTSAIWSDCYISFILKD